MNRIAVVLFAFLFGCPAEKTEAPKPAEQPATQPEAPPPPPPAAEAPPAGGTGAIKGVVAFAGTPPKPQKIDMKKDPACMKINTTQEVSEVSVADGKLADVFVRIAEGLPDQKWPARTDAVTLDQKGCVYVPQMIGIQVDQPFLVLNSDPLLHNVHAYVKRSEFNLAMPKQGSKIEKKFKSQDLEARIACEVHPWMQATLRVVDHPFFAVTGADGSFTIENVPAGKYKLELEHAKLGKQTMDVEVTGGQTADVKAELAAK
jgi:hypothetical protein